MQTRLAFWALAAATLLAACGGKVAVDDSSAGTGGTTTSTSNGGAGVGGSPAKVCGGKQGFPCAQDEWCQWDPAGSCGGFDNTGTCQPKPDGCPGDCPGVCGCDGAFYCNACQAHEAGFDVSTNGTCGFGGSGGGPDPEYAAYMLPTDVPRYVIAKAEHAADRCVLVTMSQFVNGAFPNIQVTMGWNVEGAQVRPHASDCVPGPNGFPSPMGNVWAMANDGKGSVKQDSSSIPCMVSVDVAFAFAPVSGLPTEEALQVDGLLIQNGGCLP